MDEQVIPNVDAGAVPANSAPESLAIAPAAVSTGDEPASAAPSSTEPAEAGHTATEVPKAVPVAEQTAQPIATGTAIAEAATTVASVSVPEIDAPNAVSAAVEPTTEPVSAPSVAGSDITSPTAASSDEPLHTRIATHLEAIFQMAKEHEQASEVTVTQAAIGLKAHVGDILHKISNGMSVAEGEMVQMLEKLFHML